MHALLRWHWVRALLRRLLLLEVSLVLQRLLLIRGHVWLLGRVALHVLGWDRLRHWRRGRVLLLGRLDSRFAVDAVGVSWLGSIQAGLCRCQHGTNGERDTKACLLG